MRPPSHGERRYRAAVLTRAEIEDARGVVARIVRPTPTFASGALSRLAGRDVLLKPEHRQRTGSFKIRGAYNFISRLGPHVCRVVAASAGNHAQGVALAAARCGKSAVIFMPVSAALPKVEATRSYGAEIRLGGETVDDCIDAARAFADEHGAAFVPPFDHPLVVAGQGTVGLEIAEEAAGAAVVVVPAGGGGLLAGVATALRTGPTAHRVVGVEAANSAAILASLRRHHPVKVDQLATMADGIAVRCPSELTLEHVEAYVDDVVTVSEEEISQALVLLLERTKAVVEPSGAVGVAALLAGKIAARGPAVAVLSGGNVDPLLLMKLIDHGLSAAGRYLMVRIVIADHPGALAELTAALARMRLNVLSVEHHRAGVALGLDEVEVLLTLETRGRADGRRVVGELARAGFAVETVERAEMRPEP